MVEYVRKGGRKKFAKIFKNGVYVNSKRKHSSGGRRVGVLVAVPCEGNIRIGWSLCNRKANDKFDKKFGLQIAVDRAIKASEAPIALSLIKKAKAFIHRAKIYYKDKEVVPTFRWKGCEGSSQQEIGRGC